MVIPAETEACTYTPGVDLKHACALLQMQPWFGWVSGCTPVCGSWVRGIEKGMSESEEGQGRGIRGCREGVREGGQWG